MWKPIVTVAAPFILIAQPAFAVNDGCSTQKETLVCDIQVGQNISYAIDGGQRKSLKLVNNTGSYLQISQVKVQSAKTDSWGEFCLSIRDWLTRQDEPGYGEVGCVTKNANEPGFGALQWDNDSSGLSVAPGQPIFVQGYVHAGAAKDYHMDVQITARKGSNGFSSFRQPRADKAIRCTGQAQSTEWSPWKNTTDHSIKMNGATVYATHPSKGSEVDAACIYILDQSGKQQKWKYCTNVNVQGRIHFPPVTVAPNEYIAAQATNTCKNGGLWDWAAFVYTKTQ